MERFKNISKKIFVKPYWLTVLIAVPGYLFVAYVLLNGLERTIYGAAAYALSSYALILSGTAVYRIGKIIKIRITGLPLWEKLSSDFVFRTKIFLFPNTLVTVLFVMLKWMSGFYYHSIWMIALGIYYFCLLILRISLLRRIYQNTIDIEQEKRIGVAKAYGFYLLLLDVALCGIVLYSLYRGAGYSYPGYLIYAMAAYSFYSVIMAVIGYIKNHQNESPVVVMLNILKLTTALVSLFALETAMFSVFGEQSSLLFRQGMIAATGFMIVAIILGMAIYLIVHFRLETDRQANKT